MYRKPEVKSIGSASELILGTGGPSQELGVQQMDTFSSLMLDENSDPEFG